MIERNTVLVTGVADYWGRRVAERLIEDGWRHVIGVDSQPPDEPVKDLDFVQADVRNRLLVELLRLEDVGAVCHLAFQPSERPSEGCFDINVMGTTKVLGACAEAGVKRVVLKSSMEVYGARADNSAFLVEDSPLRGSQRTGYIRDMVEIEAFSNGFRRQTPGTTLSVLRFPSIIGPTADTPLTRLLRQEPVPTLLGFDPQMQLIHEDDVTGALVHALDCEATGVFNVAAHDAMPLSRVRAMAGKLALPLVHLLVYWGRNALSVAGAESSRYLPLEPDYIRYSWMGDLGRMSDELLFTPRYTAAEALREYAGHLRVGGYVSDSRYLAYDEQRLRDTLERRRRVRQRETEAAGREEVGEHD